jgi:uncharacterized membrane protein YdjX (TVP38/TMEM64 family)
MPETLEPGAAEPRRGSRARLAFYLGAALLAAAALVVGGRSLIGPLQRFAAWVQDLGIWGPVVFILGYAAATVAFAPGAVLTLAAGALFGLVYGTVYTLAGATLGASLAFLVSRYVARRAIEHRIAGNPRFQAIDRAVGREGFKIVALLRLSPVFPFNLLNYALGLTRVRFLDYFGSDAPGHAALRLLRQGGRQPRGGLHRQRRRAGGGRALQGGLLGAAGGGAAGDRGGDHLRHPAGRQGAAAGAGRAGGRPACRRP